MYCIKAFSSQCTDHSVLPYLLEYASAKVDIWSVGVILYQLATGQPLVKIDRNDDIVSGEGYHTIYTWSEAACQSKMLEVKDAVLCDLISNMLVRDPEKRLEVSALLKHVYFRYDPHACDSSALMVEIKALRAQQDDVANDIREIRDKVVNIEGMTLSLRGDLSRGFDALKQYITASDEMRTPTMFVICPVIDEALRAELAAEAEASKHGGIPALTKTIAFFNKAHRLYDRINKFGFKHEFVRTLSDEYYMYLICELCCQQQTSANGPWPLTLSKLTDKSANLCKEILPLAHASLGVAKLINGTAGVARMLGYPVPTLSLDAVDLSILEDLSSLSAGGYKDLEQRLFEAEKSATDAGSVEQLHGYCQREFERLLADVDAPREWAELRRVVLDEGYAMWCCQRCCDTSQP